MSALKKQLEANGTPEAEINQFTKGASNFYSSQIKPNFENYEFYIGESMKEGGM